MARCKSCGAAIEWKKDYMGNYYPLNLDGSPHYSSCPNTEKYRALKKYSTTGKIHSSNKYGINYSKIILYLSPFPKDISKYHIDHKIPLCSFNLENPEEIKKAFAPENHQWLLAEENLKKGGRIFK